MTKWQYLYISLTCSSKTRSEQTNTPFLRAFSQGWTRSGNKSWNWNQDRNSNIFLDFSFFSFFFNDWVGSLFLRRIYINASHISIGTWPSDFKVPKVECLWLCAAFDYSPFIENCWKQQLENCITYNEHLSSFQNIEIGSKERTFFSTPSKWKQLKSS